MTSALVQRRDYLDGQRRTIIARALLGSLAGTIPLPFVDDWAIDRILGGGYRRIAAAHQVDLTNDAVNNLVHGNAKPISIADMAATGILARVAGRAARKMMIALATINRARSAARTFTAMTLFDHYCARLHRGLALDGPTALALRDEIVRSIDNTPGTLGFHPFRRAALAAARATLKAPLELADLASGGRVRKLLAKPGDVAQPESVNDIEQAMEAALADKDGFLSRTVASVEAQLSSEVNPFLDSALDSLDRRWRARIAAGVVK